MQFSVCMLYFNKRLFNRNPETSPTHLKEKQRHAHSDSSLNAKVLFPKTSFFPPVRP